MIYYIESPIPNLSDKWKVVILNEAGQVGRLPEDPLFPGNPPIIVCGSESLAVGTANYFVARYGGRVQRAQ
jgi:hypothetical protein